MKEFFIPLPEEKEVGLLENVRPLSGIHYMPSDSYGGSLIYTNYRIMYVTGHLKKKTPESLFYFMIPFERMISAKIEKEKKLLGIQKIKKLIFHYETAEGIIRKASFQIPWQVSDDIVNDITLLLNKAKEEHKENLMEPGLFKEFVAFMHSEKGVSPLYYDPVSRAIQIGNGKFYIKKDLTVIGDKHVIPDAKRWLDEFLSRR